VQKTFVSVVKNFVCKEFCLCLCVTPIGVLSVQKNFDQKIIVLTTWPGFTQTRLRV